MAGTSTQPSNVSTEDTPPDRPQNVVTDETQPSAAGDDSQAAPDDKSGQSTDDSAPSDPDKSKPKRDRSAERRIARLTKKLAQEQDARTQDRQRIDAMERELEELKAGRSSKPAKKPDIKDFDTPEEYARAFATYEAGQRGKKDGDDGKPGKRSDAKPPARKRDEPPPPPEDDVKAFVAKGKEKLGDEFLEAYQNPKDVPVNPAMGDYMLDSDVGAELYVWLYNNPDEALKIYRRSETGVVRKLDQLTEQIEKHGTWDFEDEDAGKGKGKGSDDGAGKDGGKATGSGKKRQESRAPEPPSPPDRGTVRHDVDLEAASMDDYAEARRNQIKKSGAPIL